MFRCPSCNQKGIGIWNKYWAGSTSPAQCKSCGSLSYTHSMYRFGKQTAWPMVGKVLGFVISFYLFNTFNNLFYLLLIPIIWVGCSFWELASLPLEPISKSKVGQSKKMGNVFLLIIAAVVIIVGVGNL